MNIQGLLVALILATTLLAGCTESEPESLAQEVGPCVVENPGDYETCVDEPVGVDGTVAHVHNYWGGRDTLTVVDAEISTFGQWFGGPIVWAEAKPAPESVVPQGTSSVNVTVSWDEAGPGEFYADPELWVRTAATNEPFFVADLQNGDTASIPITEEDADLPHQVLSSWTFQWVVSTPDDTLPVTYSGDVSFLVTAHDGLPIRPYPGHPDRWDNQTEIALLEVGANQNYMGDGTNDEWGCFGGCPEQYSVRDGVVIPTDADRIEATLTMREDTPFLMGLAYHGADSREFIRLVPESENGLERTYIIPVEGNGDGPYARQSLWEFAVFIEGPEEDGFTSQGWDLTASVYREAQ